MKQLLAYPRRLVVGLLLVACLAGCAHGRGRGGAGADSATAGGRRGAGDASVQALRDQLSSLADTVQPEEAQRAAACAHDVSLELAREYRVVRPAFLQNLLVNLGLKKRGLCYHWTEDLTGRLEALQLSTLQLRWGIARHHTAREHNSVVVTAVGQPFEEGLVLDPWRRSGRLVWMPVTEDRYPWVEGWRLPEP